MSSCLDIFMQPVDTYVSHRRPPFFTIVSSPSTTASSAHLKAFGAFGALCGLFLAITGRAPSGLSPLHFIYAISNHQVKAITHQDLEQWDPEVLELMKDLRLQGPALDFRNFRSGIWLDRIYSYLGGHVSVLRRSASLMFLINP